MKNSLEILASTPPKIAFRNARDCASRITELESKLGLAASPPIWNISKANRRIAELESMVAARSTPAAPAVVALAVEPVAEKFGRERFCASVTADAARKPKSQNHPEKHGRERFSADVRVDSTPQILSAKLNPVLAGLTGRARFVAAVKSN